MMYRIICSIAVILVLGVIVFLSESQNTEPQISSTPPSSDDKVLKGLNIN